MRRKKSKEQLMTLAEQKLELISWIIKIEDPELLKKIRAILEEAKKEGKL